MSRFDAILSFQHLSKRRYLSAHLIYSTRDDLKTHAWITHVLNNNVGNTCLFVTTHGYGTQTGYCTCTFNYIRQASQTKAL